jgi:hypothetical protein
MYVKLIVAADDILLAQLVGYTAADSPVAFVSGCDDDGSASQLLQIKRRRWLRYPQSSWDDSKLRYLGRF